MFSKTLTNKTDNSPSYTFMIVSPDDSPLLYFTYANNKLEHTSQLNHLIINAALDFADSKASTMTSCYLGKVDQYMNKIIYAYVLYSGYRLLLIIEPDSPKNDEAIKSFFIKVHERVLSKIMTPLPYWKDEGLIRDISKYFLTFTSFRDSL